MSYGGWPSSEDAELSARWMVPKGQPRHPSVAAERPQALLLLLLLAELVVVAHRRLAELPEVQVRAPT